MPVIGRETRSVSLQKLTTEEIQARWGKLLPKVLLWLAVSVVLTATVFFFNHYAKPAKNIRDIMEVAYQIGSIFVILFAFLTAMASFFKSNLWVKKK